MAAVGGAGRLIVVVASENGAPSVTLDISALISKKTRLLITKVDHWYLGVLSIPCSC